MQGHKCCDKTANMLNVIKVGGVRRILASPPLAMPGSPISRRILISQISRGRSESALACRELMTERTTWKGTAAELLITAKPAPGALVSNRFGDWPRTPRARRKEGCGVHRPFFALWAFRWSSHEKAMGTRVIQLSRAVETTVSIVSAGPYDSSASRLVKPLCDAPLQHGGFDRV